MTVMASPLFTVERSTNSNQLIYELSESPEEPIHAYWKMLADDGHLEELTSIEKAYAYGVQIVSQNEREIIFRVEALSDFPVRVSLDTKVATMLVSGQQRLVDKIYLHMTHAIFPKVKLVEIFFQGEERSVTLIQSDSGWKVQEIPLIQADRK